MSYPRLLKRPNGYWYVELMRNKYVSLQTKKKPQAHKMFIRIKRKAISGKLATLLGECSVTLGDYCQEFLAWSESNQPRSTFRANRLALNQLQAVAGSSIKLDRLGLKHLDEMVTACRKRKRKRKDGKRYPLSNASINNYIRHARAALNKAVVWEYIKRNPLAQAKEMRTESRQPGYLPSQEEIARFLGGIENIHLRRLTTAYLSTGRRRNELLGLQWKHVDMDRKRYLIDKSKTHMSKWYPMNSMFRSVLLSIKSSAEGSLKGRVFPRWGHPDTVSKLVKAELVKAGWPSLRLHDLRHTFAAHALMQGRTMKALQDLLGHTEARTTEIYAHLADDYLAEAAEIRFGPINLQGAANNLRTIGGENE